MTPPINGDNNDNDNRDNRDNRDNNRVDRNPPPRPRLPFSQTDDALLSPLSARNAALASLIHSRSNASLLPGDAARPQLQFQPGAYSHRTHHHQSSHSLSHDSIHPSDPSHHHHRKKDDGDTFSDAGDPQRDQGLVEAGHHTHCGNTHRGAGRQQSSGDPHLRTVRLIGDSIPRYRWEKYWRTEEEIKSMKRPIRRYYERTNSLIQQYRYIDRLLDSDTPYALLSKYNAEVIDPAASSAVDATVSVLRSPVIDAVDATESIPHPPTPRSLRSAHPSSNDASTSTWSSSSSSSSSLAPLKKAAPTPRQIFRSNDVSVETTTPLLFPYRDVDVEATGSEPDSGPGPGIAWDDDGDVDSGSPVVTAAIWVNFVANAILLAAKIIVVIQVPSLSVLASLVDAGLDFLSTAIVWATTRLISRGQRDLHQYPAGRRRLEPLGVLVFSVVMITAFAQVALECVQRLATAASSSSSSSSSDHHQPIVELGAAAICIMVGTIVIKGGVWIWYRLVKNSSVRALADDAKTDVVFNTGSILFPIIGFYARLWWLDALGGLLLSCFVIFSWGKTAMHHVRNLTGFSAEPDQRNLLLYLAMRFSATIQQIQNLRAYHAGDKLLVEADIVLAPHTPLKDSHDLSEVLTYFLESVPFVERAFVHVDYASYHLPTHLQQGDT